MQVTKMTNKITGMMEIQLQGMLFFFLSVHCVGASTTRILDFFTVGDTTSNFSKFRKMGLFGFLRELIPMNVYALACGVGRR